MRSTRLLACATALGLTLAVASPALSEGKMDRARAAVAEARGKVEAAVRAGTGGVTPRTLTQAQDALRLAEDDLKASRKDKAIADAQDASRLADASGVTIDIDSASVPIAAPESRRADALRWGDDYQLLFTLPAGAKPAVAAHRIGEVRLREAAALLLDGQRGVPAAGVREG